MNKNNIIKRSILGVAVIGLVLIYSCRNEETVNDTTTVEATETGTEANSMNSNSAEVKVNPPHGQPGHDCGKPVGAPLGSQSAGTTPMSQTPSKAVSPVLLDQTPDVNPPHGEPGHDCGKPVGAPLK